MNIQVNFRRTGYCLLIGKKSRGHAQLCNVSLVKEYYDENGEIEIAKTIFEF